MNSAQSLPKVNARDLARAFGEVGLAAGETVYVGSSMAGLSYIEGREAMVLEALWSVIGRAGTLVLPTGSREFRQSGIFDREKSVSAQGLLSEYFRRQPGALRSFAPPFNAICAMGPQAQALCSIESETSFGPDSVYERMAELRARQLMIGCNFRDGVSHMHCLEERHDAPYREWRPYTGKIVVNGTVTTREFRHHTRIPSFQLDYTPLETALDAAGAIKRQAVGLTMISSFSLEDFFDVLDPWFVANWQLLTVKRQHE